jgi:DNA-binding NtrC family response regulator
VYAFLFGYTEGEGLFVSAYLRPQTKVVRDCFAGGLPPVWFHSDSKRVSWRSDLIILVIDDDVDLLNRMGRYLKAQGHEVETAASAAEALGLLTTLSPGVVFLDLFLPDQSGLSVLAQIRKIRPMASIVMMSGGNTTQSSVSAIRMGADDCLDKPFPLTEMIRIINEFLKKNSFQVDKNGVGNDAFSPVEGKTVSKAVNVATYDDAEKEAIIKALEAMKWNRTRAAEALGISRRTVINKIRKWNLSPKTSNLCSKSS